MILASCGPRRGTTRLHIHTHTTKLDTATDWLSAAGVMHTQRCVTEVSEYANITQKAIHLRWPGLLCVQETQRQSEHKTKVTAKSKSAARGKGWYHASASEHRSLLQRCMSLTNLYGSSEAKAKFVSWCFETTITIHSICKNLWYSFNMFSPIQRRDQKELFHSEEW